MWLQIINTAKYVLFWKESEFNKAIAASDIKIKWNIDKASILIVSYHLAYKQ